MKKILIVLSIIILVSTNISHATEESAKIYISNNKIYYYNPGNLGIGDSCEISAPKILNIDLDSVEIINNRYFRDKNKLYTADMAWRSRLCYFKTIEGVDPATFKILNENYQKDKSNIYYTTTGYSERSLPQKIEMADYKTFEVLNEDVTYALDKNNMYLFGKILNEAADKITNNSIYQNLKGKIILKVEDFGKAFYIHPNKQEMHFLSRPIVAFYVMREQGIGISNSNLEKIPVADNYCPSYSPDCDNQTAHNLNFSKEQAGKIFLQVEENGEAWYVNPNNNKRYFLGRPTDAFNVMRNLGLGISNSDFDKL